MPAQSTMEGIGKLLALGAVAKGGLGGINEKVAKLTGGKMGSKAARSEVMYDKRQAAKKKKLRDEIFDDEVYKAKQTRRANGSWLQAIKDASDAQYRINDVEEAHAEALKEEHSKQRAEYEKWAGLDAKGRKRQLTDRKAGNTTEVEWLEGSLKRREALDRKRNEEERKAYGRKLTDDEREIKFNRERRKKREEEEGGNYTFGTGMTNWKGSGTKLAIPGSEEDKEEKDDDSGSAPSSDSAPGAGFGSAEILHFLSDIHQAIEEQTDEVIYGLGTHSPPFLETLTKDEDSPSIDLESVGAASEEDYTAINGAPDVSMESMLDGEPMSVKSDQFEELLGIEREELDFDRRREAREIKAERRALEDRRDSKFSKLKMGGFGRKGKKPDKKKGGGLMDMLLKFGARFLLPIGALTGGWLGMKSILGLSTKGDDAARLAKALKAAGMNADDAARLAQLKATDDAARALQHTDDLGKTTTKVVKNADAIGDITKTGAKTTRVVTVGEDVLSNASKLGKVADGVPSTNLAPVLNKADETTKGLTKVGSKLDRFGNMLRNLPKTITNLVKGVSVSGGGVSGTTTTLNKVVTGMAQHSPTTAVRPPGGPPSVLSGGKPPVTSGGPPSMMRKGIDTTAGAIKNLATNPTLQKVGNLPGVNVLKSTVLATTEATTASAKMVKTVVGGLAKGASRVAKVLLPLDILGKMDQGQGFFESMGNMVIEVGNLALGAGELATEQFQDMAKYSAGIDLGQGGFSEKSAGDIAFKTADIFSNEEKWQTHKLEEGIDFAMAKWYGTEIPELKKVFTEEQEELVNALENEAGIVDVGVGQGDIEDLEKLSLLDEKSLQALLDVQVWDDEDQKLIEDLVEAKKAGVKITYDDGGVFGGEFIKYGGAVEGQTAEQKAYQATLTPEDAASGMTEYVPQEGDEGYKVHKEGIFSGFTDIFSKFSADPVSADKMAETTTLMAENANAPGSIFTHDTHLEKTLWDIWEDEKTFLSTPKEDTTVDIAGEKDGGLFSWLTGPDADMDSVFAPQLKMFGNQKDLIAPVPVIDVSRTAPVMGEGEQMMSSELLARKIDEISSMKTQATAGNQGANINASSVTNTNAPVINQIAAQGTVHGPITPGTNR